METKVNKTSMKMRTNGKPCEIREEKMCADHM